MKQIEISDTDIKQMLIVTKMLAESKYEIKGDAIPMCSGAMQWAQYFYEKLKSCPELTVSGDIFEKIGKPERKSK